MTEKLATQQERIFEMFAGVESRLQNLEGIFEKFSALGNSVNNLETELNEIGEKTRKLEGEVNDLSKSMGFANTKIEKKNDKENEVKIKELEDKYCTKRCTTGEKT